MANAPSTNPAKIRLLIFGGLMLGWTVLIGARLVYLQIYRYGDFVKQAQRQQQRTVEVSPRRGVIYDRNGQELAMSVPVDSVFAVPSEIPDQENTASILARVTGLDPEDLLAKLKSGHNFAWIARKLDQETSERIRSLNLRGIYFEKESKRYYPKRELAAQVLGIVGTDDDGLAGIERSMENQLRGQPGTMIISQDARRRWFGRVEKQPDPGENVVLTIDEKIQYIVEKELERAVTETHAVSGTVVVQNPRTGEILALANYPTFNPNVAREITPAVLKNHAVSDVYEPGSVFKTVTFSSALEETLAKTDEVVDCNPGYIEVGGIRIHDSHHIGVVKLDEAYAESSDVAAVKMGLRLGPDRFYKHIRDYGFGQQTGIELPGETRGLVKPPARWSAASIGSMSIGQEVGVTPLQVISMVSAIANDGIYSSPRIVAGDTTPQRGYQQVVFHPANQHRVLSTMTAAQMRHMMEMVVLDGTARRAILDGYTSAGKTGTAQKVDPRTHTYSHTDYVGSFVGFAPVNSPAVTVAVILDSAKGLHQGGQVSAPVFKRITEQVLAYMHVPHDVEPKVDYRRQLLLARAKETDVDESLPHSLDDRLDLPAEESEPAQPVNTAAVTYTPRHRGVVDTSFKAAPQPAQPVAAQNSGPLQQPEPNVVPHPSGTIVLDVASGQVVPEFVGKSLRASVQLAQQSGLELEVVGNGVAREQSPAPGTRVTSGSKVAVRFTR